MISLLLAACLLFALAGCGAKTEAPAEAPTPAEEEVKDWTLEGYFTDENENILSITWMEDIDEPGWYVGCMLGEDLMEDSWGGTLQQEGNALRGVLPSSGSRDDLTVTVSEEGADGVLLTVEGGESYHFRTLEMPEATIIVHIDTEGWGGMIGYEPGETVPELDPEWPYQSAQINLAGPETYTFAAAPEAGHVFVKWMKNGEDLSTEPVVTVQLDESADFVAVFEEDPGWQNPVMNFIGEYQSGRAHALVECFGNEDAWITIEWGGSAWELARWDIVGKLDTDTLTIEYSGCTKSIVVYDDNGEIKSQEPEYEDGTGTITFNDDGTFTWHEDQSEYGSDMVFEWLDLSSQLANPWREITEEEAKALCPLSVAVPDGAENVQWSVMESAEEPLVQLSFDLDGNFFTARAQVTGDPEADISGMYYDWTYQREESLKNWGDAPCRSFRFIGDEGYADLCTWYDGENALSYSLGVTAEDLDGFDLLAIAEALHG